MPQGLMPAFQEQLWVELSGGMVIAKMRGGATAELIECCQQQVQGLLDRSGATAVLYDGLELQGPLPPVLRRADPASFALAAPARRGAIVLSDGAALRRALLMAFGVWCDECRAFSDLSVAHAWLRAVRQAERGGARLRV